MNAYATNVCYFEATRRAGESSRWQAGWRLSTPSSYLRQYSFSANRTVKTYCKLLEQRSVSSLGPDSTASISMTDIRRIFTEQKMRWTTRKSVLRYQTPVPIRDLDIFTVTIIIIATMILIIIIAMIVMIISTSIEKLSIVWIISDSPYVLLLTHLQ